MFCNSILLLVLSAIMFILVIEIVGDTGPGRDDTGRLDPRPT